MAKAIVVEDKQLNHIVKVARVSSSEHAVRNVALIYTLFGTGLMPTEIAKLQVDDYLGRNGSVVADGKLRAEVAFNDRPRPLMWVSPKLVAAIDAYLEHRVRNELGASGNTLYRGLRPKSALFLARGGEAFGISTIARNGKTYFESNALTRLLNTLMRESGVEGATTASARRTFAVKLYRNHKGALNLRDIGEMLGQSSLKATRKLVEGDTVSIRDVVQGVI